MGGWVPKSVDSFVLWWWVVGHFHPFHLFSDPVSGLSLNVCQPPRPYCCLCSSIICPVGVAPWPFTAVMPAGAMVNARLHLQLPCLPSPHPIFPICSDRSTFRCLNAWISQKGYVLTGSPLLNYSCPSCNFKGRDLGILSYCQPANTISPPILDSVLDESIGFCDIVIYSKKYIFNIHVLFLAYNS